MTILRAAAFAASFTGVSITAGLGSFLAAVEQSGARAAGSLMAFGGIVAFAAALLLIFASPVSFRRPGGRALAVCATVLALAPVAGLAGAALVFVGNPFGSVVPRLDWAVSALGAFLTLGAVCLVILGYRRAELARAAPLAMSVEAARPGEFAAERMRVDHNLPPRERLQRALIDAAADDVRVTRV